MTAVASLSATRRAPRAVRRRMLPLGAHALGERVDGDWALRLESTCAPAPQGRYSYFAVDPVATLTARGAEAVLRDASGVVRGDTLTFLTELIDGSAAPEDAADLPWAGGLAGYVAYDFGRLFERWPARARNDLDLPDVALGVYDAVAIVDHATDETTMVASGWPLDGAAARDEAERRLDRLETRLLAAPAHAPAGTPDLTLSPDQTYEQYVAAIARVQRAIRDGDIYQANVAHRFSGRGTPDPRALARRLAATAPAQYAATFLPSGAHVFAASPELFLARRGARVMTRPIKGTRPRGATPAEDTALAQALRASEKDRAEHTMIVDVERNDLGRVAVTGTVRVAELAALESFATLHHLTSTVTATLRRGVRTADLLRATFPGGSITGAPKIRAMEIIEEVEPVRRGVYTGAIGWFGFGGDCELAMAIRTLVSARGGVHLWVGGGIVADSRADDEYEETLVKGRAIARALGADLDAVARV